MEHNLSTIGVLAHGLDIIYPAQHSSVAHQMTKKGGLITEFLSETKPDKENFPKRNRIVAGICEATIVIESGQKGGSLITAGLANDYNRDVFAFPGNAGKVSSIGCNELIKHNRAHLITGAQDIIDMLGWAKAPLTGSVQPDIFPKLSEAEHKVVTVLKDKGETPLELLSQLCQTKVSELLIQLFNFRIERYCSAIAWQTL